MDSLTQIALGAAVGESVMLNKVGRKASLWGAILGTLPDLDVLIPMGDAVSDFTYHRAASHSLFFMALAAPIILWIILRLHPDTKDNKIRWLLLIFLSLFTHSILDSFTVYGTQMYLPFSNYPVGWSSIFVIDPIYTIPLLLGVISFFVLKRKPKLAYKLNIIGIIISSLYLVWTLGMKAHVNKIAEESFTVSNINVEKLLIGPSPFNTLLWRVVGMTESGYVEGFYSVFDKGKSIKFRKYESDKSLLNPLSGIWEVERLKWFSKGFYKVENENNRIIISDLRMGVEPLYFFRFAVGVKNGTEIEPTQVEKIEQANFDMQKSLKLLWKRIWDENLDELFTDRR